KEIDQYSAIAECLKSKFDIISDCLQIFINKIWQKLAKIEKINS
ncbi:13877_t:CDS:1, partial [Gigaspora margarita]